MFARRGIIVGLLAGVVLLLPGRARAQAGYSNFLLPSNVIIGSQCAWNGVPPFSCNLLDFDFMTHHSGPFDVHRLFVSMIAPGYFFTTPLLFPNASDEFGNPITPTVISSSPTSFFIGFLGPDPVLDQPDDNAPPFDLHLETTLAASPSDPFAEPPVFSVTALNRDGRVVFTTTPEPTTLVLMGSGLAALVAGRRRRKGKQAAQATP